MSKSTKIALFLVIGYVIAGWIVGWLFFYHGYMERSKNSWGFLLPEIETSPVLNKEFGEIKKVKLNNFLRWYSKKQGYECVMVKITTDKGKYKVCAPVNINAYFYFVDNYAYNDTYSKITFEVYNSLTKDDNSGEEFYKSFEKKCDELYENANKNATNDGLEEFINMGRLKKHVDNIFEITTRCEYGKIDECNDKNRKNLEAIISSLDEEYYYEIDNEELFNE